MRRKYLVYRSFLREIWGFLWELGMFSLQHVPLWALQSSARGFSRPQGQMNHCTNRIALKTCSTFSNLAFFTCFVNQGFNLEMLLRALSRHKQVPEGSPGVSLMHEQRALQRHLNQVISASH